MRDNMFIKNGKRINIYAPYLEGDTQYANLLDPQLRELLQVEELAEPTPPEDVELYIKGEFEEAPYVKYFYKPEEQVAEILRNRAKAKREDTILRLKVTTQAGNEFDADEVSQNRMSRAITGMTDSDALPWVLADNSIVQVNKAELVEALRLAGQAMAQAWLTPYE